jgi:hypothetical protein
MIAGIGIGVAGAYADIKRAPAYEQIERTV